MGQIFGIFKGDFVGAFDEAALAAVDFGFLPLVDLVLAMILIS